MAPVPTRAQPACEQFQRLVQAFRAHRLDAGLFGQVAAQQFEIRQGPGAGRETRPGADEIRFGALGAGAGNHLQFVGEVGGFQYGRQNRAFLVAHLRQLQQLGLDVLEFAGKQFGSAGHHLDLPGSPAQQIAGLEQLDRGILGAVRKAADGARAHGAACQRTHRQVDIAGPHGYRSHAISPRRFNTRQHLRVVEMRLDQRVVEPQGEILVGCRSVHYRVRREVFAGHFRPRLVSWVQAWDASALVGKRFTSS